VSNTATKITVATPWDVIPTSSSRYCVTKWASDQLLIKENTLIGQPRGIWLYTGGHDTAIVGNTLTNSEGIWLRHADYSLRFPGQLCLQWDTLVDGNTVTDSDDTQPAFISLSFAPVGPNLATTAFGVEFRNNFIDAVIPNHNAGYGPLWFEGYAVECDQSVMGDMALGTIFQNNEARDAEYAYRLSTGASQSAIWDPVESGESFARFLDMSNAGAAAASIRTVTGSGASNPRLVVMSRLLSSDLGTVLLPGDGGAVSDGPVDVGGYDLKAGEGLIGGTSDSFQYSWQEVSGDFDVQVRIEGFEGFDLRADQWFKAATVGGLMVRESLTNTSRHALMSVYADASSRFYRFSNRSATGGTTATAISTAAITFPDTWLRLSRSGDVLTGYRSVDGVTWTEVGSATLSLPETVCLGLAVCNGNYNRYAVCSFSGFQLSGGGLTQIPSGETVVFREDFLSHSNAWTNIGEGTGKAVLTKDIVTGRSSWLPSLNSDGAWVTSTAILPCAPVIADGPISVYARVRVDDVNNADANRFSISLTERAPSIRKAALEIRPGNTALLYYRNAGGATVSTTLAAFTFPDTSGYIDFRLTLTSNNDGSMTLAGFYYQPATSQWVLLGTTALADIDSGMFDSVAINSRNATGGSNRAYFESVSITRPATLFP